MKVALVQCPVWGTREPPLSIVQLAACLKSRCHDVRSYDLNNFLYKKRQENMKNLWAWEHSFFWYEKESVKVFFDSVKDSIADFTDLIMGQEPKLIGFSITAATYLSSIRYSQILKKENSGLIIVFGGQIFKDKDYLAKAFNEAPVDYIITGEGDQTFPDLCDELENNGIASDCSGVYFKSDGQILFTKDRQLLKNLDNLPYMDYSDIKISDYDDKEHFAIMSSRGCIWDCSFCSSRNFWGIYREMSAERLHQELTFHKLSNPWICHIDFQDLAFNANISRVEEFCDLMIKYPPFGTKMLWVANAIINPKMTKNIIEKMALAGCKHLIFGIESGSQKVLQLMNKNYCITDAKRIIRDVAEAEIKVTGNFMFGFPGETEEDFKSTLDFIKDTGKYFTRVYPSRTYCAIEEYSKLHLHPERFHIKTPFSHHLYWETDDGLNTYPVRLARCKDFEKLCLELGVRIDSGVRISVELDEWFNLGNYYEYLNDYGKAFEYFKKYQECDPKNEAIINKINLLNDKVRRKAGINL